MKNIIDKITGKKRTFNDPFYLCVRDNKESDFNKIIKSESDFEKESKKHEKINFLALAAKHDAWNIFKLLISYKSLDVNADPLIYNPNPGNDPNSPKLVACSPAILYAAEYGDIDIVKLLINKKVNINAASTEGRHIGQTAIWRAAI